MRKAAILVIFLSLVFHSYANLVVNGTFDADSDWTKIGTCLIQNNRCELGAFGDNRGAVWQAISTRAGKWYKVTFDKGHIGDGNNDGVMVAAYNGNGITVANAFWGASTWGQNTTDSTFYFQAIGSTTTILLGDFNYVGASHDVTVDNVVVEEKESIISSVNIAGWAAISQSSTSHPALYLPEMATDGIPLGAADGDNFMHTETTASDWLDLTFEREYNIDRIVISARPGFTGRLGDTIYLYDGSDALVDTVSTVDGFQFSANSNAAGWAGVKRIRIEEGAGNPLNFSEVEVYAQVPTLEGPNLIVNPAFIADTDWTKVGTCAIGSGRVQLGSGGDNRGAVYQTVSTQPYRWYEVSFEKQRVGNDYNSGIMITAFNGAGNANADAFWGASHWGQARDNVTHFFRSQAASTTIQLRDFNYNGAAHDPVVDNVNVRQVTAMGMAEINIAGLATLSQSSYFNAGLYPASYGVDGVPNNFMHTVNSDPRWFDMDFSREYDISRIVVTPREGYLNRAGETVYFYDEDDVEVGTATLGDSSYIYKRNNSGNGWNGVKRIRVVETDAQALNFAEIEVYTEKLIGPYGSIMILY